MKKRRLRRVPLHLPLGYHYPPTAAPNTRPRPHNFVVHSPLNRYLPSRWNESFQQPRAAQQSYGYRQTPTHRHRLTPPYPSSPMQSSQGVYNQPQPQQVPVAPSPTVAQPRERSGASRRTRSSVLRLVDPNTNRDVLTGEEVPPSAVVTPTTSPVIVATGVVSAPVEATDEVEATAFSETDNIAPTPSKNTNVAFIEKIKAEEKTVPTIIASPTPSVPAAVTAPVGATPINAVPVTQQNGEVPSSRDPPNNIKMTAFLPINFPANMKSIQPYLEMATDYASVDPCISYWCRLYALEQGFLLKRKEENLPFLLELMQILGKNKLELQSKIETTDIPIARAYLEGVIQKLLNWAESAPPLVSFTDVVKKAFHTARMLLDVCSIFGESSEDQAKKYTDLKGANLHSVFYSIVPESAKSTSLKPTYKDDQSSSVNLQGNKTYERNFLLKLQNSPASQKKPEGLARLEIVRDKAYIMKRSVSVGDFTPSLVKKIPEKGLSKRNSQQGNEGSREAMGQQQRLPKREINSLVRQERPEDPNVWKPKHASKSNEWKENPEKAGTEAMLKTVRGILNKLTLSKFETVLARIQALDIDSEDRLEGVIKLFYEKAVDEPIFSFMYAKMCQALSTKEVASTGNPAETTNFRKLLLRSCQRGFEKDSAVLVDVENKKKEIERAETEDKKKELELELEDMVDSNQRKSLGNMRFIGELFKLRILSVKVMHQCILRLLSQPEDEFSLECLCVLLSTIGKELETQVQADRSTSISTNRETMNSYFSTLDIIVNKRKVSNRICLMIQDLVDLRKTEWEKPRRVDNNPETINQIHNPQFKGLMGSMNPLSRNSKIDRRGGDFQNWKPSRFSGRSLSQLSRENSVIRPKTAQLPKLSRKVPKGVLMGKSTVTEDEIERKSHALLSEHFANEKIEDFVLEMKEWLHLSNVARFINQCLLYVLESNKKERRATGTLLKEMVKRKLFQSSDILEGFTELFERAEDFIVDIPKLWEYVAEVVVPLFEEGVINLNFLPQLSMTLNSSMVANFVAAVLKELVKEQGVAGAEKMFIMSNVPLTSILPSNVDPNAFLAQHTELDFLSKVDSILKNETPSTSQVNISFRYSLEKYLRDATRLTTDEVCSWIQEQYVGDVNHVFIRALGTAVIESSIEGRGTDSKLNNIVLKHWTVVLRCYVGNIPDRELQLLYAVQTLVAKRQHPKGLIQGIFETLYDSNVVSEEGFESWVSVDDPLEGEGKAVALKMITSFLTWLKEADPESDQEADA